MANAKWVAIDVRPMTLYGSGIESDILSGSSRSMYEICWVIGGMRSIAISQSLMSVIVPYWSSHSMNGPATDMFEERGSGSGNACVRAVG